MIHSNAGFLLLIIFIYGVKYVIYPFTHENILTRQTPVGFISRKKYVKYWSIRILLGPHTHVSLHKKMKKSLMENCIFCAVCIS